MTSHHDQGECRPEEASSGNGQHSRQQRVWGGAGDVGGAVDVIVPVYNALEDVQRCIESVLRSCDRPNLRLIIVNDGSDLETSEWLRGAAERADQIHLIEHLENRGYTKAVNSGIAVSTAPYVVLLNSDTIVTKGWAAGLIRCMQSSPSLGIVGPMSNAASWQSLPLLTDAAGGFAVNTIPTGITIDEVAELVSACSGREYPRTPFVNGFCFMIRRAVLDAVGQFDEQRFPVGYGEENDFCIRAFDAGNELAVADDVYVFHAKSRSFGHERRKELSKHGSQALKQKHGADKVDRLISQVKSLAVLDAMRYSVGEAILRLQRSKAPVDPLSMKILFLLPVKGGSGGAHSVIQEATAMLDLGVFVRVAVREVDEDRIRKTYRDIPQVADLLIGFNGANLLDVAEPFDIVVATVYASVELLRRVVDAYPSILPAYYVQDYEPLFFERGSPEWQAARDSYAAIPGAFLFAKTDWIRRIVNEEHGLAVAKVAPSLDHSVYKPMAKDDDQVVHIAAMIRPQTPRRAAARTMRVLRELTKRHPGRVAVHLFGCDGDDPLFQALPRDFQFINYGALRRPAVALLLRRADVFIDLSDYQAFGRTGLEAMASGCAVMLPSHGGTDEYARDNHNAILVDTQDEAECMKRLEALVSDWLGMRKLRVQGLLTAAEYSVQRAVTTELEALSQALTVHRARLPASERRTMYLLPRVGASGELSAAAHVRLLGPWGSAAVRRQWKAEVVTGRSPPDPSNPGLAVLQAGATAADASLLLPWLEPWRKAGGKFVVDLCSGVFEAAEAAWGGNEVQARAALQLASVADAVLVATPERREQILPLNLATFVVPTRLDADTWRLTSPSTKTALSKDGAVVRVGLISGPLTPVYLELIRAVIERLKAEHHDRVAVEVVGAFESSDAAFGLRVGLPRKRGYPEYVDWLHRRIDWDIGILLADDAGADSEALELAFLQYSALGMASCCSDTRTSQRIVRHGVTGWLVANELEAWHAGLNRLIEDTRLRQQLAAAARIELCEQRTTAAAGLDYLTILEQVSMLPRRGAPFSVASADKIFSGAVPALVTPAAMMSRDSTVASLRASGGASTAASGAQIDPGSAGDALPVEAPLTSPAHGAPGSELVALRNA